MQTAGPASRTSSSPPETDRRERKGIPMYDIDTTHDPKLKSWVSSANEADSDFPIQNLPFGRFRPVGSTSAWRIGVAGLVETDDMNLLMAATPEQRLAMRRRISEGLREGSSDKAAWSEALVPQ